MDVSISKCLVKKQEHKRQLKLGKPSQVTQLDMQI